MTMHRTIEARRLRRDAGRAQRPAPHPVSERDGAPTTPAQALDRQVTDHSRIGRRELDDRIDADPLGDRALRSRREPRPAPQVRRGGLLPSRDCRAAVLDVEGTLLDSTEARVLSWFVALHDCGRDVSLDLLRTVMGMGTGEFLPIVAGTRAGSDDGRRMIARQAEIFRTWYLPRLLPFEGTRRLVQRMKGDGLRLVALVGHGGDDVHTILTATGIADLFTDDDIVGAAEPVTTQGDLLEMALARLGSARDSAVLLADSPYDIATANTLGLEVVALRCGGWSDEALDGAAALYRDPADLYTNYQSSPFSSRSDRYRGPADLALMQ